MSKRQTKSQKTKLHKVLTKGVIPSVTALNISVTLLGTITTFTRELNAGSISQQAMNEMLNALRNEDSLNQKSNDLSSTLSDVNKNAARDSDGNITPTTEQTQEVNEKLQMMYSHMSDSYATNEAGKTSEVNSSTGSTVNSPSNSNNNSSTDNGADDSGFEDPEDDPNGSGLTTDQVDFVNGITREVTLPTSNSNPTDQTFNKAEMIANIMSVNSSPNVTQALLDAHITDLRKVFHSNDDKTAIYELELTFGSTVLQRKIRMTYPRSHNQDILATISANDILLSNSAVTQGGVP